VVGFCHTLSSKQGKDLSNWWNEAHDHRPQFSLVTATAPAEQRGRAQAMQEMSTVRWGGFLMRTWDGLVTGDAGEAWTGRVHCWVGGNLGFIKPAFLAFRCQFSTGTVHLLQQEIHSYRTS